MWFRWLHEVLLGGRIPALPFGSESRHYGTNAAYNNTIILERNT